MKPGVLLLAVLALAGCTTATRKHSMQCRDNKVCEVELLDRSDFTAFTFDLRASVDGEKVTVQTVKDKVSLKAGESGQLRRLTIKVDSISGKNAKFTITR